MSTNPVRLGLAHDQPIRFARRLYFQRVRQAPPSVTLQNICLTQYADYRSSWRRSALRSFLCSKGGNHVRYKCLFVRIREKTSSASPFRTCSGRVVALAYSCAGPGFQFCEKHFGTSPGRPWSGPIGRSTQAAEAEWQTKANDGGIRRTGGLRASQGACQDPDPAHKGTRLAAAPHQ